MVVWVLWSTFQIAIRRDIIPWDSGNIGFPVNLCIIIVSELASKYHGCMGIVEYCIAIRYQG